MSSKIAIEGDTVTQSSAHSPLAGGGTYTISPATLQGFVFISGKPIIVNGQTYSAHDTATVVASSTFLFINGVAVAREGDTVNNSPHSTSPIVSTGQSFVWG